MIRSLAFTNRKTVGALALAVALISMSFAFASAPASADILVNQCNGVDNVGGEALECSYTVTNNVDGDVTSSTTTLSSCHGAANDPPTMSCSNSTTHSVDLVTSINQCNGSGNGGGGQVTCHVDVLNNIVGGTETPTAATVNQCNASGTGGGTEPTILCGPYPANTTMATVTQCNESGTEGGGTVRVQCTVDSNSTETASLRVTVNQCNGSGAEGGATVYCDTAIINNVTPATVVDDGDTDVTTPDGDDDDVVPAPDDDTPKRPSEPEVGGPDAGTPSAGTPSAPRAPGESTTTSQITRVPTGGAAAGGGFVAGGNRTGLVGLGLLLSITAGWALVVRKRTTASA